MFVVLLLVLLGGATVHAVRLAERTRARVVEVYLVWLLVGYCGVPMLLVSAGILVAPAHVAMMLPLGDPSSPLVAFFGWGYLALSVIALPVVWWRGAYLRGPALAWAVYLIGATLVHFHGAGHGAGIAGALHTVATHGGVGLLLVAGLVAGGSREGPVG